MHTRTHTNACKLAKTGCVYKWESFLAFLFRCILQGKKKIGTFPRVRNHIVCAMTPAIKSVLHLTYNYHMFLRMGPTCKLLQLGSLFQFEATIQERALNKSGPNEGWQGGKHKSLRQQDNTRSVSQSHWSIMAELQQCPLPITTIPLHGQKWRWFKNVSDLSHSANISVWHGGSHSEGSAGFLPELIT